MADELRTYLRKLGVTNATVSTSGTGEDALSSVTIPANTLGVVGGILFFAAGTITGINDAKTIKIKIGTTVLGTIAEAAGATSDWIFVGFTFNTATNAQRTLIIGLEGAAIEVGDYVTSAIDTTTSTTINVTGECANAGDTVSQTMLGVFLVQ